MRPLGLGRTVALFGFAMGGLVAGHAVDYVVQFPSATHRHSFLELSGHAHMHTLRPISIALAISAAAFAVWQGARRSDEGFGTRSYRQYALHLIAFQTVGFVGMEVVERLASGHGLQSLPLGLLALGIVIQAVIALVAALVMVGLEAIGAKLARTRAEGARVVAPTRWFTGRLSAFREVALGATRPRGPPTFRLT